MTKVEEVARAIAKAAGIDPDIGWRIYIGHARAAIEEMRPEGWTMSDVVVRRYFNAILDAALNTPANAPETPVERGNGEGR